MNDITSPYIKLFVNKGIKWHFAVSDELIKKAERENKLLFIHIGYIGNIVNRELSSTLFGDMQTIEILNNNFVSIIADREEKPETFLLGLDLLHMQNDFSYGPINIIALPDRRPLLAFSSITPEEFAEISESLIIANIEKRELLQKLAEEFSETLSEVGKVRVRESSNNINREVIDNYFRHWEEIDFTEYFFNKLKPYTPDPNFIYLLEYLHYKDSEYIEKIIYNYLNHIQFSPVFDPIDGGIFRQATDFSCLKPLFEKGLSENSRFLMFYALASKYFNKDTFAFTANEIFRFIKEEMDEADGGICNSVTLLTPIQDSHYYFYSIKELKYLFPENYKEVGRSLGFNMDLDEHVKQLPINGIESSSALFPEERDILSKRRREHTGYFKDKRFITASNCDAINSIALASKYLNNSDMLKYAEDKFEYIRNEVFESDKLICRCLCGKDKRERASLSDYTYYIQSLLTFYEITAGEEYLAEAVILTDAAISRFYKRENGMFAKSQGEESIFPFGRESNLDLILPSINSVMTGNLINLYIYTGRKEYLKIAEGQINNVIPVMLSSGQMLLSWGFHLIKYYDALRLTS